MSPPDKYREALRILLILDLGTFQIESKSTGTGGRSNGETKQQPQPTIGSGGASAFRQPPPSAAATTNDAFYDRYRFSMSNMQVMLTRNNSSSTVSGSTIVQPFECVVDMSASMLPQDPTLTRAIVEGKLPELKCTITTRTRRQMLQLLIRAYP